MSTITISRTVDTTAEEAWRAWTEATELATWWWPQLPDTVYHWEPAEGAAYRITSAEAGFGVSGIFTRLDPPRLLACTWNWESNEPDEAPEDTVEVSLEPAGDRKTIVTVRHTSTEHLEGGGAQQGWDAIMDRLAARS